jgi:hypothetical protein
VLVEQIDNVGLEALERGPGDLLDVLRAAVEAETLPRCRIEVEPNLVAIITWSRTRARASPTSSSLMKGP